jgi:hypothetical protein
MWRDYDIGSYLSINPQIDLPPNDESYVESLSLLELLIPTLGSDWWMVEIASIYMNEEDTGFPAAQHALLLSCYMLQAWKMLCVFQGCW